MARNYFSGMSGGGVGGWMGVWVAGLFGNITSSAPTGLGWGLG